MSWQHRDYANVEHAGPSYRRQAYGGSGMRPRSVTTTIIIANVVVYLLTHVFRSQLSNILLGFGVMQAEAVLHGQIWRLWTATYLHANAAHILFNMLGLYFFGPALERVWGPRQYFLVYTLGGIIGNILLTIAGLVGFIHPQTYAVGASGSVLAMLGSAAVLFPNAQIYVYFLFPIRIRTFVLLYGVWFAYNILQKGANYGGDICHVGGLALGLWWAYTGGISLSGKHKTTVHPSSLLGSLLAREVRRGHGAWDARVRRRQEDDALLDELLDKVHREGIQSLTDAERRALEEATARRRADEAELRRRDKSY